MTRVRDKAAADWLDELAKKGFVRPNPAVLVSLEKLLRSLRARHVEDGEEFAASIAALLAKNNDRYTNIRDHVLDAFRLEEGIKEAPAEKGVDAQRSSEPVWRRVFRLTPRVRRRLGIAFGVVGIGAALWLNQAKLVSVVDRFRQTFSTPVAQAHTGLSRFLPRATCEPPKATVEPVLAAQTITKSFVPEASTMPNPWWHFVLAGLCSLGLGLVALAYWFLDKAYARQRTEEQVEARELREKLIDKTKKLGVPYDVKRAPPFDESAMDDAATLLGRLSRQDTGYELDVDRTIDATIEAGGRVKPVFLPGGHREALLVWVDVEQGDHPYLDGVNWVLERWKRLGVPFVRYDFRFAPTNLEGPGPERHVSIERLARRTEGMPLLVFSRFKAPRDVHRKMPWLHQLDPWPVRAFIDLDPRGMEPARGDELPSLRRIEKRLPRYSFTKTGLVDAATRLHNRGQTAPLKKDAPYAKTNGPVAEALVWWAGAAACVPDPTWVHLDDLRRLLPEVHEVFPQARDVQHLLDEVRRRGLGRDPGTGSSLVFTPEGTRTLLEELRRQDRQTFPHAKPNKYVEHRVRTQLIAQLEQAKASNKEDPFGEAKRKMKADMHRAVIGEKDIEAVIEEHGKLAAAEEMGKLIELLQHLHTCDLPGPVEQGWSVRQQNAVAAWFGSSPGARASASMRPSARSIPRGWALAGTAFFLANVAMLWFVRPFRRPVEQSIEFAATLRVVIPDEPPALCDVAPMPFVKIPAGEFVMGSPKSEDGRNGDETQHRVWVGAFEMATHEVTQKQWTEIMNTKPFNCGYGCGEELPAQNVSMYDAMKFMNKLTDHENAGRSLEQQRTRCYDETNWSWDRACTGYRLPTEAEWEYAARAGTTTAYSFGNEVKDLCIYGNFADASAKRLHPDWSIPDDVCNDGKPGLAPIGNYKANPWGLYDMHGNVWEWVWDKYATYSDKPQSHDPDAHAGASRDNVTYTDNRVLRGGSVVVVPRGLRSANRNGILPTLAVLDVGFRCVRVVPAQR